VDAGFEGLATAVSRDRSPGFADALRDGAGRPVGEVGGPDSCVVARATAMGRARGGS
jgi:hypothetical protein